MKTITKKSLRMLCLCLVIAVMMSTPVFATESKETTLAGTNTVSSANLKFISSEEMDQLIINHESGVDTYNWFPDYVVATVTNEGSYCKVVFMNVGFPFDRCDVDGSITLYDSRGRIVASHLVTEHKLIYGVARVEKIYPSGGSYASGSYSLRISDGDLGTLYSGRF